MMGMMRVVVAMRRRMMRMSLGRHEMMRGGDINRHGRRTRSGSAMMMMMMMWVMVRCMVRMMEVHIMMMRRVWRWRLLPSSGGCGCHSGGVMVR